MSAPGAALEVALVQCDIVWEDRRANLDRLAAQLDAAVDGGARLVLLPEMFATGFSMATDVVAEGPDARTPTFLREQATARRVWVGGSFACRVAGAPRPVNRFLLAGPAGEEFTYDKVHPFSFGKEHEHYAAGATGLTAEIDGLGVTPFICYDLRFADGFWNAAPTTDCYVVVASWPAARQTHWRALIVARAIENQAYVLGVNRVGTGGGVDYAGGSLAVGPFGDIVAEGGSAEELVHVAVDGGHVADVRARFPFLADR